MKVVLFDIDGTLLSAGGAGRRAVEATLARVFGTPVPAGVPFDGKTDPQIVRELLLLADVPGDAVDAHLPRALDLYLELLHQELAQQDPSRIVHAGVPDLLEALEERDDVLLGLLTGNLERGAAAKLGAVGLDPTRFRVGAYGSDHASRAELPAIARERAATMLGREVNGADLVILGDTPADMSCGQGIGARAIGVATGRFPVHALRECGAAAVFPSFVDTRAVVDAICAR